MKLKLRHCLHCRYSQFWPRLWGWKELGGVRRNANKISLGLIWGGILAVAITMALVIYSGNAGSTTDARDWAWIDVVRTDGSNMETRAKQIVGIRHIIRQIAPHRVQIHTASSSKLQAEINNRLEHPSAASRLLRRPSLPPPARN